MKTRILSFAFGVCALALAPAHADDTEIYLGENFGVSEVRPNIVFIIDTSGSMRDEVENTGVYDPAVDYTPHACDPNKIYWGDGTNLPNCATTNQWISVGNNKCNAAVSPLANTGRYSSQRVAGWDSTTKRWVALAGGRDRMLECEADNRVHGETTGDARKYPLNGSTYPWTSTRTSGVNWGSTGSVRTLYSGNYLNYRAAGGTDRNLNRLEVVQKVLNDLFDSLSGVNVAIMRFSPETWTYNKGGYFIQGMTLLDDTTRASMKATVDSLGYGGNTPLAETLYEAALYYRGDAPYFGTMDATYHNSSDITYADGKYVSPIEYQCQKNFIVLLTDGAPTYDYNADSRIQALPGFSVATGGDTCRFIEPGYSEPSLGSWYNSRYDTAYDDCLDELAEYLHDTDSSEFNSNQNVITYTIGFHTDQALLNSTAAKGGTVKAHLANDLDTLADAFTSILTEIQAVNTYFSAPAVSVNAFNRLTNLDELYYALFKPSELPKWDGNVKRYRIGGSPMVVRDVNGDPAIDENTGFFKSTAKSWWLTASDAADGDQVKDGGVAFHMPAPADRKVFTWLGGTRSLTAADNRLHESNAAITTAMLGVDGYTTPAPAATAPDTQREDVLQWARGVDLLDSDSDEHTDDARLQMGDPLHTEPLLVTYGKHGDNTPDLTLFATDNEGFLHGFSTKTGVEQFAFIPKDLLPNLTLFYDNSPSVRHPYGLDGPLTTWVVDNDHDGFIETGSGDHVYLYVTMRRGGRNIYALDVSNRDEPTIKWEIRGGTGDFAELGQTWSKPILAKVKLNGQPRTVLIFGGGYDVNQDTNALPESDTQGRAVFMIDADTGVLLWKAAPVSGSDLQLTGMTNSIPSEVRVIDTNGDGYSDLMYVGDTRGQLWRFDIKTNNGGRGDFATGGVIATLGGTSAADNRRFYYPPSVSLSITGNYFNIAIGSGWREHPLNGAVTGETTIEDKFFVLRDRNMSGPARDVNGNPSYTPVTLNDLYDATADDIQSSTAALQSNAQIGFDAHPAGYYINMNSTNGTWEGEKVLAQAITIDGVIIFTTFTPVATASSACAPSQGTAKYYIIEAEKGGAVIDHNGDGEFVRSERATVLARSGIPPRPTAITTDDGSAILVGTEKISDFTPSRIPRRQDWIRN